MTVSRRRGRPIAWAGGRGVKRFRMGYASALAWALFVIIMVLTLVSFKTSERLV